MLGRLSLPAEYNTRRRYAILLLYEGAPSLLTYWNVACFLAEHLKSRRLVDTLPRCIWYPILYLLVLPWRTFYETRSQAPFWIPSSHLTFHTPSLLQTGEYPPQNSSHGKAVCVYHLLLLVRYLKMVMRDLIPRLFPSSRTGEISVQIEVAFSSQPRSVDAALERFHLLGNYTGVKDSKQAPACVEEEHLVVMPLYPQYSSVHTAVAFDVLTNSRYFASHRTVPHLHFLRSYATKAAYISALTMSIRQYCAAHGAPDWLFVVFDGLSRRFITSGDCYQVECQRTFTALREALSVNGNNSTTTTEAEESALEKGAFSSSSTSPTELLNYVIPSNRITISFLDWGVEPSLEPSPRHVVAGIAAQFRQMKKEISTSAPDESEKENKSSKALGTAYFVCPGMAVDDIRSLHLVRNQLCEQCLELGWLRAEYIPAMNESFEQVKMLANIILEYIR